MKIEAKHTPGPWAFKDEYIRADGDFTVADPYCMPTEETKAGEMEANARLMAASPDLLDALKFADSILDALNFQDVQPVREEIRSAIANAEGAAV